LIYKRFFTRSYNWFAIASKYLRPLEVEINLLIIIKIQAIIKIQYWPVVRANAPMTRPAITGADNLGCPNNMGDGVTTPEFGCIVGIGVIVTP
jgi:hypothetical protein